MMELHPFIIFLGGLVMLITGAEWLLRGATGLADALGMSPLIIGLTIVAIGTSIPELAVGITAATEDRGSLAVGNVVGANIVNILLILGLAAIIRPMALGRRYLKLDMIVMVTSALVLLAMALDGVLMPWEGLILALGAVIYTAAIVKTARRKPPAEATRSPEPSPARVRTARAHAGLNALMLLIGVAVTILGADLLVSGAVDLARAFGVSDAFIGLTIVSIGTTAPECATAMMAILKDRRDVAVGTLVGSYIYNILVILGISTMSAPAGIRLDNDMILVDLPFMMLVALACAYLFTSGRGIMRGEGAFLVLCYCLYLGALLAFRA